MGDAIFDSCKVATSVAIVERLYASLHTAMVPFQAAPAQQWRQVEGCIYCLRQSISKNDPTFFTSER